MVDAKKAFTREEFNALPFEEKLRLINAGYEAPEAKTTVAELIAMLSKLPQDAVVGTMENVGYEEDGEYEFFTVLSAEVDEQGRVVINS